MREVAPNEHVARLLIKRTRPPEWVPFRRTELYPPRDGCFSNVCGEADGLSVDRCDDISPADLVGRSNEQAARRANRVGDGALVANVGKIRQIQDSDTTKSALRVYDDPMNDNEFHAIIRGCELTPPEEQGDVLVRLAQVFDHHVQ